MTDKLTPWYPPHIKPVRVGVYETDAFFEVVDGVAVFQYWNGRYWGTYSGKEIKAATMSWWESKHQNVRWRGLAHPPK